MRTSSGAWSASWRASGWFETLEQVEADGGQSTLWDCEPFEEAWGDQHTQCMSNAIHWSPHSDTILYSFFTSMTVVELDRSSGETLNSWGQLSDWSFDPPESRFDWQHGVSFTDQGNLLLSTHADLESFEGVVREYELDHDEQVLRQVWSFGEGDGIESEYYGEAHRLPGGNTLHNYGSSTRIREATPGGEVAWDIAWHDDEGELLSGILGRSVLLGDLYELAP